MQNSVVFDPQLIQRHDRSGPRYTSYPTALQFDPAVDDQAYQRQAEAGNRQGLPLSLYFHIPFCAHLCFYCACNKVVTRNRARAEPYLADLYREIELQGALFAPGRPVNQLHWGGGTPTFISTGQMRELMVRTGEHFALRDDSGREYSVEIDPREADAQTIAVLAEIGFNRMSLGVQDFDPQVQQAVHRVQSEAQTLAVMQAARDHGFDSINIDLIYGLPLQSVDSFDRTLDRVIEAAPDRLSVFNYAHMPQLFAPQRRIREQDLPSAETKLAILARVIERLQQAGYVYIGMDHFARPDDALAIAQREGRLYRNFQGYSTHADCELVAMGVTAISHVGESYTQNHKELADYHAALARNELPVLRGVELNDDDRIRRRVIQELICHFRLDFSVIEALHGIDFGGYFAAEVVRLQELAADGLVRLTGSGIEVTAAGRLLIRNICMVFDRYLPPQAASRSYSRVI